MTDEKIKQALTSILNLPIFSFKYFKKHYNQK